MFPPQISNRVSVNSRLIIQAFILIVCLCTHSCSSTHHDKTYIPKDLGDAHEELLRILPATEIEHIKAMKTNEMVEYHFSLGTLLRNNWGLWHNSRLARYFNHLGVDHPDGMSSLILSTFWSKLHGESYNLRALIGDPQEHQEYLRSQEVPKGGSPKDGARIKWVVSQGRDKGRLHLGISTSDLSYWRCEYGSGRGIEPATEADRKDLDELTETWKRIGTKIEDILKE